jgi:HD-GYP domain-containing protein (c-di-GMP phosphodiesterase class II)
VACFAADQSRLDRIADAFALIIDAKSPFTFDHSRRVAAYALAINERLGDAGVDAVRLSGPRSFTTSGS